MSRLDIDDPCPVCRKGRVKRVIRDETFERGKRTVVVKNAASLVCDACGESFIDVKRKRDLTRKLGDAERALDGLLTTAEIRSLRERLGYDLAGFAALLGISPKNCSRYETGAASHGKTLDQLLRILAAHPETLSVIDPKAGKRRG